MTGYIWLHLRFLIVKGNGAFNTKGVYVFLVYISHTKQVMHLKGSNEAPDIHL